MIKWIHHLLNPHCIQCAKENPANQQIELLITLLESEKRDKQEIIKLLTAKPEVQVPDEPVGEMKPMGGIRLWDSHRRHLEMEAHKKLLQENEKANEHLIKENLTTEELEEQLLVDAND